MGDCRWARLHVVDKGMRGEQAWQEKQQKCRQRQRPQRDKGWTSFLEMEREKGWAQKKSGCDKSRIRKASGVSVQSQKRGMLEMSVQFIIETVWLPGMDFWYGHWVLYSCSGEGGSGRSFYLYPFAISANVILPVWVRVPTHPDGLSYSRPVQVVRTNTKRRLQLFFFQSNLGCCPLCRCLSVHAPRTLRWNNLNFSRSRGLDKISYINKRHIHVNQQLSEGTCYCHRWTTLTKKTCRAASSPR